MSDHIMVSEAPMDELRGIWVAGAGFSVNE